MEVDKVAAALRHTTKNAEIVMYTCRQLKVTNIGFFDLKLSLSLRQVTTNCTFGSTLILKLFDVFSPTFVILRVHPTIINLDELLWTHYTFNMLSPNQEPSLYV